MRGFALPEPPEVTSLQPQLMTATELKENLERLFGWLQLAEAAPDTPEIELRRERSMQAVRDAANLLLNESRERHSDETAPRGG